MRYWAVARYDLGLTSEEFFECTPRQLDALIQRHERSRQDQEFLFAQLTACVVNFSRAHPKEPIAPKDLMPSEWAKKAARTPKRKPIDRNLVVAQIKGMMDGLMRRARNG